MFSTILTQNPLPHTLISAMYKYYQDPKNEMSIGELYLLLKMVVSKLEDELEKMGMLDNVVQTPFNPPVANNIK